MNLKFTKLAQQILGEGIGDEDAARKVAHDSHKKPDTSDNLRGEPRPAGFGAKKAQYDDRHAGLGATRYGVVVKWKDSKNPKWLLKKDKTQAEYNVYEHAKKAAATMKDKHKQDVEDAWVQELPSS